MASVTGPLMSMDASGTLAGTLVFSKWKGRNYVRSHVIPANPKSAGQTGIRSMMRYLSQLWASIAALTQASWDELAATTSVSAFNAFVGHNLSRWQNNLAPTEAYPALAADTDLNPDAVANDGVLFSATDGEGSVTVGAKPDSTGAADAVAALIFRGAAAPTPLAWNKLVRVVPVTPGTAWSYVDSPLIAGTYHYKIAYISADGAISALSAADVDGVAS